MSMKDDCRCSSLGHGSRCVTGTGHSSTRTSPVNLSSVTGRLQAKPVPFGSFFTGNVTLWLGQHREVAKVQR